MLSNTAFFPLQLSSGKSHEQILRTAGSQPLDLLIDWIGQYHFGSLHVVMLPHAVGLVQGRVLTGSPAELINCCSPSRGADLGPEHVRLGVAKGVGQPILRRVRLVGANRCQSSPLTLISGGFVFSGSGPVNVATTLAVSPAISGATGRRRPVKTRLCRTRCASGNCGR